MSHKLPTPPPDELIKPEPPQPPPIISKSSCEMCEGLKKRIDKLEEALKQAYDDCYRFGGVFPKHIKYIYNSLRNK
jgi:hypothetical protein